MSINPSIMQKIYLQQLTACFLTILLSDGANINSTDADGRDALINAVLLGKIKAVKVLLEN
uniref:Uncharacterized protein n=1 Tax=Romanomermis culicivorax TaxID=13658 RepID=A0A915JLB5_ROMCU